MVTLFITGYTSYFAVLSLHITNLKTYSSDGVKTGNGNVLCKRLSNFAYFKYFLASFGDMAGCFLMASFVDLIGRKKSIVFLHLLSCGCFVGLMFFYETIQMFTIIVLVARASITATLQLNSIYTAELFPTIVRASVLGICMMGSRVSMILLPFMVLVFSLLPVSLMIIFSGLCIFSIVLCIPLPETKGRDLVNS